MTAGRPRTPAVTPAGLATQRTALAWTRTGAGLLLAALLAVRAAALTGWPAPVSAAGIVVIATAVIGALVVSAHRNRVLPRNRPAALRQVRATALVVAVLAVAVVGGAAVIGG